VQWEKDVFSKPLFSYYDPYRATLPLSQKVQGHSASAGGPVNGQLLRLRASSACCCRIKPPSEALGSTSEQVMPLHGKRLIMRRNIFIEYGWLLLEQPFYNTKAMLLWANQRDNRQPYPSH
jgi:hypothetical protein